MPANIRAMTPEDRKIGFNLQQDLFTKTGDFLAWAKAAKIADMTLSPGDKVLLERMRAAFQEYNKWLKR